jgi:hypothetical protein
MQQAQLNSKEWPRIIAALGGHEALAASAKQFKAFVRARELKCATDLLRVCFAYGPGGNSLRTSAATAAAYGIADVSDVAILGRVRRSGDWLKHLCEERLKLLSEAAAGLTERPIRIVDGSRLPGPGGRAWRLLLAYDLMSASIIDAEITPTSEGEKLDRLAILAGEIRLADRGFAQPDGIKNTLAAGGDLVVRLTWNSVRLTDRSGRPLDWLSLFKDASSLGSLDISVELHKARGNFKPIAMRLVIIKKTPEAAAKALAKAQRASSKDGHKADPRTLAGTEHIVLLTSLKQDEFSPEKIGRLYRLRWQIEIAIKRLKSILHIDQLPAKAPDLARAWLHAHLLFALLLQEKSVETDAFPP